MVVLSLAVLAFHFPNLPGPSASRALRSSVLVRADAATATWRGQLVGQLLATVEGTDRGVCASEAQRNEALKLIEILESSWRGADVFSLIRQQQLFRRAEVAYVGTASSARANPAGGKYRGRLGRLLFRTDSLFQHVLAECAVNVIHFRLLGLIPGSAILEGRWRRPSTDDLMALRSRAAAATPPRQISDNVVTVEFGPPRIAFGREGRALCFSFGPSSTVSLDTT